MASQEVNEKTGDAENPSTACTRPMVATDSSCDQPDTLLERQARHQAGTVTQTVETAMERARKSRTGVENVLEQVQAKVPRTTKLPAECSP